MENKRNIVADRYLHVAQRYHERIRHLHPTLSGKLTSKSDADGALVLSELVRIDGHDWEMVKNVLRWALKDEFWSRNLMSLGQARRRKRGGNTKFLNCAIACDADLSRPSRVVGQGPQDLEPREQAGELDFSGLMGSTAEKTG